MSTELERRLADQLERVATATQVTFPGETLRYAQQHGRRLRRRRQWMTGTGAVAAAAIAGLIIWSVTSNSGSPDPQRPVIPSGPQGTPTAKVHHSITSGPLCRAGQLKLTVGAPLSMMTGEVGIVFRVVNRSQQTCVLHGRTAVAFFDSYGKPVAVRLMKRTQFMNARLSSGPGPVVPLRPGGEAFLLVAKNSCVGTEATRADRLTLSLPRQGGVLTASMKSEDFASCRKADDPGQRYAVSDFNQSRDFVSSPGAAHN